MRCGAEWQYIYVTINEIIKDLRTVPCLTAVSAESKSEISNSAARKKNLLVYRRLVGREEGSN